MALIKAQLLCLETIKPEGIFVKIGEYLNPVGLSLRPKYGRDFVKKRMILKQELQSPIQPTMANVIFLVSISPNPDLDKTQRSSD